jgi:hypothetical protein
VERVSATRKLAPQRNNHCAIAMPVSPRPKINTRLPEKFICCFALSKYFKFKNLNLTAETRRYVAVVGAALAANQRLCFCTVHRG